MGAWVWESRVCRTRTPTLTLESCLESRIGVLGVRVRVRSTHTQREGRFSAISDGRSPGKRPPLAEIRGERIKAIATKGHRSTRKETLGGIPFCGFSCFIWCLQNITPAVTGAFVVSAASEKCVRVNGLVSFALHLIQRLGFCYAQFR